MLALYNNNVLHIATMRNMTMKFSDKLYAIFMRGHDVIHVLNSTIMRSLNWLLSTITLTEEECTHIMAPVIKCVLAKKLNVSTIKRDILF